MKGQVRNVDASQIASDLGPRHRPGAQWRMDNARVREQLEVVSQRTVTRTKPRLSLTYRAQQKTAKQSCNTASAACMRHARHRFAA